MPTLNLRVIKRFRASKNKDFPNKFRPWPFSREFIEILNLLIIK